MLRPVLHRFSAALCVVAVLAAACAPTPPAAPAGSAAAPKTTATSAVAAPTAAPAQAQPTAAAVKPAEAAAAKPAAAGRAFEAVVAQPADPPTLDPQKPGGTFGGNLFINLYDTLATHDTAGTLIPGAAESWSRVGDKQWRYIIRKGITFTNGEVLDAHAVKFTADRIMEPGKVRQTHTFSVFDRIEVVDDYTVDFYTKQADPLLPGRMVELYIMPPKYTVEIGEDDFTKKPVGSGPFKFVEALPNQRVTLEANPNYWRGKPSIDRLTFRTIPEASTRVAELMAGNVDLILDVTPEQADAFKSNPRARVEILESKRIPFVNMNLLDTGPKELKDKRVRQALNYAVNVDAIITNILNGHGRRVATMFRKDFPGYDESVTPYEHDPAKAKQLLAEAGYPDGFSTTIQTSDGIILKGVEVAQVVANQLAQVGVKAEVEPLEFNVFRSFIIGGQAQGKLKGLFVTNWGARPGDSDAPLTGALSTGGSSSHYTNPELDKLIVAARQAPDDATRAATNQQIQRMLKEEAPFIYLYQAVDLYGVSNRVSWTPRLDQYIHGREISPKTP